MASTAENPTPNRKPTVTQRIKQRVAELLSNRSAKRTPLDKLLQELRHKKNQREADRITKRQQEEEFEETGLMFPVDLDELDEACSQDKPKLSLAQQGYRLVKTHTPKFTRGKK